MKNEICTRILTKRFNYDLTLLLVHGPLLCQVHYKVHTHAPHTYVLNVNHRAGRVLDPHNGQCGLHHQRAAPAVCCVQAPLSRCSTGRVFGRNGLYYQRLKRCTTSSALCLLSIGFKHHSSDAARADLFWERMGYIISVQNDAPHHLRCVLRLLFFVFKHPFLGACCTAVTGRT